MNVGVGDVGLSSVAVGPETCDHEYVEIGLSASVLPVPSKKTISPSFLGDGSPEYVAYAAGGKSEGIVDASPPPHPSESLVAKYIEAAVASFDVNEIALSTHLVGFGGVLRALWRFIALSAAN